MYRAGWERRAEPTSPIYQRPRNLGVLRPLASGERPWSSDSDYRTRGKLSVRAFRRSRSSGFGFDLVGTGSYAAARTRPIRRTPVGRTGIERERIRVPGIRAHLGRSDGSGPPRDPPGPTRSTQRNSPHRHPRQRPPDPSGYPRVRLRHRHGEPRGEGRPGRPACPVGSTPRANPRRVATAPESNTRSVPRQAW
jgi:hypothetical protein